MKDPKIEMFSFYVRARMHICTRAKGTVSLKKRKFFVHDAPTFAPTLK